MHQVATNTHVELAQVVDGRDKIVKSVMAPRAAGTMSVADVQRALTQIGFFPGGHADGICGYRTQAAIRLFQEYVRTVEHINLKPDGQCGPQTRGHIKRWIAENKQPNWSPKSGEYEAWLALLEATKQKYMQTPGRFLEKVNAFTGATNTRKVADWDMTGPDAIHLIGVRRNEFAGKFDDMFVLLIKGLVFKFQGSTEPGSAEAGKEAPLLAPGQHNYRFGWHQSTYQALRPLPNGVLVLRLGNDLRLDEADLAKPLESNTTINIHWAGLGMSRDVSTWSKGCQVINGTLYMNPAGEIIDCGAFAAVNQSDFQAHPSKTRGAFSMLADLVTVLSGDMPSRDAVRYMLLPEADLDLAPDLKHDLEQTRAEVMRRIN